MYAIINDRGKQYKVREGDEILIEKMDLNKGDQVEFDDVKMLSVLDSVKTSSETLNEVKVVGSVLGDVKGGKINVFKYKRRKGSRTKSGHRQTYTKIKIEKIERPEKEVGEDVEEDVEEEVEEEVESRE